MNEITLSEIINPGGSKSYRVYGVVGGKMHRKQFSGPHGHALAMTHKQNLEREQSNLAPLPAITTRLTDAQAREAELAFARITGQSFTLSQAIDYAIANFKPVDKSATVATVAGLFLAAKIQQNLRPRTLQNLRTRLDQFTQKHGTEQTAGVSLDTVRAFISGSNGAAITPRTQRNRALVLSNFFGWAQRNGYVAVNPLEKLDKVKVDTGEPETLSLDQVRRLLNAAASVADGALLPYVVLALFAGIRPAELERLTWDKISADTVRITPDIAKVRGRRLVDLPENAQRWLATFLLSKPAIVPANFAKIFAAVRKAAGIRKWHADVMRHTAISNHLAMWEHEGRTALWAGNSPDIIQKHYRKLTSKSDAATFWSLVPDDASLLALAKAA